MTSSLTRPIAGIVATFMVSACAGLPGPSLLTGKAKPVASSDEGLGEVIFASAGPRVVVGESGIAAGIPAAVQVFAPASSSPLPSDGVQDPGASSTPALRPVPVAEPSDLPTLLPRQLPSEDRYGDDFADRVSLAPDGRRLAVATQQGAQVELQIIGVNRKNVERRQIKRGTLTFVGWSDARTVLIGTLREGTERIDAVDIASGRDRTVSTGRSAGGVLMVDEVGRTVTTGPGRTAFRCANATPIPTEREGAALVQAGPLNGDGHVVLRSEGDEDGVLVPFDCDTGRLLAPLYEGEPFDGALFSGAGKRYLGVWDDDGVRYLDKSLSYEMGEVARSFPGEVAVWPIEFASSPNTLLLYVSGTEVPPSYYVLDRYAGALDLHVSYDRQR